MKIDKFGTEWLPPNSDWWPDIWKCCQRRVHHWLVPPRWSVIDWWEELDAINLAAAWLAVSVFDPARGTVLPSFVYHRMIQASLEYVRREWRFARFLPLTREYANANSEREPEQNVFQQELMNLFDTLKPKDKYIINSLYWEEQAEDEIAKTLGISQQAVSKRKLRILQKLRIPFLDPSEITTEMKCIKCGECLEG